MDCVNFKALLHKVKKRTHIQTRTSRLYTVHSVQSRKLKSRYGTRNQFQEPSLELSSQAIHRLAGRYDNPMPPWFLAPIEGLKLPTQVAILGVTQRCRLFGQANRTPVYKR